jgi:hypothetical protein
MFVDTAMLYSGAAEACRAGEHAHDGASHLSGRLPVAGMFGDFAAAAAFRDAVGSAHACHVAALQHHRETLGGVGVKTHLVADSFSAMDDDNAEALRDV